MLFNKSQVLNFLPHRDPFLFIDSVSEVTWPGECQKIEDGLILNAQDLVGATVTANYKTLKTHPIFAGHFPGRPILPGVVQVEMMAQASSFILIKCFSNPFSIPLDAALVRIGEAKFRKPILPEMDLVIQTECRKVRASMIENICTIYHNGQLMSEAVVLAAIQREE